MTKRIVSKLLVWGLVSALGVIAVPDDGQAKQPGSYGYSGGNGFVDRASCDDPRILWLIQKRFKKTQRRTFHRNVNIVDFQQLRPISVRYLEPAFHDRLYCEGQVILDNGRHHSLVFQRAFAPYFPHPPLGAGLQFCIVGYDDYRAHAPACSQLRPR